MSKNFKRSLLAIFGIPFLLIGGIGIYAGATYKDAPGNITWGVPELFFNVVGGVLLVLGIYLVVSIFRVK